MARRTIPEDVLARVRAAAQNWCGYCLSPQHLVMARLQIEHTIPRARGGTDDEANLWLACPLCNNHKRTQIAAIDSDTGDEVPLFDPRTQLWHDNFAWTADGLRIVGRTAVGRATVVALQLSTDPDALLVRSYWVQAGWHPPRD